MLFRGRGLWRTGQQEGPLLPQQPLGVHGEEQLPGEPLSEEPPPECDGRQGEGKRQDALTKVEDARRLACRVAPS